MKVFTQSVNFNADKKLIQFANDKVSTLTKFHDKIVDAEVFLKVQNTSSKENKITEILLSVPGDEFMIKKINKSFEEGVDECVSSLERQLRKRKDKLSARV